MLIFIILITPCISVNVDVLHILLKGEAREVIQFEVDVELFLTFADL